MEDSITPQPASLKLVAQWIREKQPESWKLAGALHAQKWDPEFSAVTESEFDAALKAISEIRIG